MFLLLTSAINVYAENDENQNRINKKLEKLIEKKENEINLLNKKIEKSEDRIEELKDEANLNKIEIEHINRCMAQGNPCGYF
jgi:predicted  nucleic acid-binding Zn-ribbon protein